MERRAPLNRGLDTDTLSSIEGFLLTAQDDLLSFDIDSLASVSVSGSGGNDTVGIVDSLSGDNLTDAGIDGVDLASVFTDIETIDFTNTDLTGSDTFDIGNDDISGITGGGNSLTILLDTGRIALTDVSVLGQAGSLVSSDVTLGNTRTVDWDNGVQLILNG